MASYSNCIIFSENFMTGYRIVFDREKLVLGWKKYDCEFCFSESLECVYVYDGKNHCWLLKAIVTCAGNSMDGSNALPSKPVNSTNVPPAVDVGQVSPTTRKSEASSHNIGRSLDATSFYCISSFYLIHSCLLSFLLIFLLL